MKSKIEFPNSSVELANYISFIVDITDHSLEQMKGSASFPQGLTRLEKITAHFSDNYDEKVITAVMTLLRREPIPFYDGENNQPLNEFDPRTV